MSTPLNSAADARDAKGRFAVGNKAGRGNPLNRHAHRLRYALLAAVKREDIREVVRALVEKAKGGDVAAIKELLDRCLGRARQNLELTGPGGGPVALNTHQLTAVILECLPDAESRLRAASKLKELTAGPTSEPGGGT